MSIARSKITAQGQISVPARVRKRLGVGPGSILVWEVDEGRIVIRRAGAFTSEEIHQALFPERQPRPKSARELKDGIRKHIQKRYERS